MTQYFVSTFISLNDLQKLSVEQLKEKEEDFIVDSVIPTFERFIEDKIKKLQYEGKFNPIKIKLEDGRERWDFFIHILTENELQTVKDQSYMKGSYDATPFMG
jgi:hypothetical protein